MTRFVFYVTCVCCLIIFLSGCNLIIGFLNDTPGFEDNKPYNENPEYEVVVIDPGFSDCSGLVQYGICSDADSLYVTSWYHKMISRIETPDNTISEGYPVLLADAGNPHGCAVNPADGSRWICDPNNSVLRHYDVNNRLLESIRAGSQPVNAIIVDNALYIADRKENSIYYLICETGVSNSFCFSLENADPDTVCNYIDLFFYNGSLYVVAQDLWGIEKYSWDGTHENTITIEGNEGLYANGIYIMNDRIYLNRGDEILITDMNGVKIDSWPIDSPQGYDGNYIDIEILNNMIYIPSWESYTGSAHILAYPLHG